MRILKNQKGDTILEVLIAVAVLSLVLTISFSLTNRNTQGNRQAQERGEATKHTESQIELLKTYIGQTTNPVLPASGSNFCMKNDGTPTGAISGIPNDAQAEVTSNFSVFEDNPEFRDNCKKDDLFYTYINRVGNTFTAHTRWYKVGGRGIDEATMAHRLYPEVVGIGANGSTAVAGCAADQFMNVMGVCSSCPLGHGSTGGTSTNCSPVLARATINVRKVRPNSGNTTPACSSTNTENRSGIGVTLSRAGEANRSANTDSSSNAAFSGLSLTSPYNVTVTAPTNYEACPAPPSGTSTVTTGGLGTAVGVGSTVTSTGFKIRPICNIPVPVYGQVDRGSWITYEWIHTGPTWGPYGQPRSNPRYQIGPNGPPYNDYGYPPHYFTAENSMYGWGWVNVKYSSLGGTSPEHYNRFEEHYRIGYHTGPTITRHVWIPNLVWEVVSYNLTCPT